MALDGFHAADVVVGVDRRICGSLGEGGYRELRIWEPAKSPGMVYKYLLREGSPCWSQGFFLLQGNTLCMSYRLWISNNQWINVVARCVYYHDPGDSNFSVLYKISKQGLNFCRHILAGLKVNFFKEEVG